MYHRLAQRGQAYSRLGINDQTPLPSLLASRRFKILTDSDYRLLVARKLRGQRQKLRFWCCVAACVALHTYNKTPLGVDNDATGDRTTATSGPDGRRTEGKDS